MATSLAVRGILIEAAVCGVVRFRMVLLAVRS
jgi:hypothetical protein